LRRKRARTQAARSLPLLRPSRHRHRRLAPSGLDETHQSVAPAVGLLLPGAAGVRDRPARPESPPEPWSTAAAAEQVSRRGQWLPLLVATSRAADPEGRPCQFVIGTALRSAKRLSVRSCSITTGRPSTRSLRGPNMSNKDAERRSVRGAGLGATALGLPRQETTLTVLLSLAISAPGTETLEPISRS
jgi:hypothetical protein